MGNAPGAFYESDGDDDDIQVDDNNNNPNKLYITQHEMNVIGVTDSGEFRSNAYKRILPKNRVKKIKEIFRYKKKLGEGASGRVLLAQNKKSRELCALKELHRKHKVNAQLFLREVVILESLRHPNILELYDIYLDKSSYFISTAYYSGGEFFDRIIKIKKFSEKQALKYINPILSAINFMHDKAIVHRDLKPSNMVFDKKGKNGVIKIIDFGTSEIVCDDDLYDAERVGTILYAPPEWKKNRIGLHIKKGDLWSLGVICYVLMVGRLPFGEWKHIENFNNDLWFPKNLKKKLSFECVDFLLKLLEKHPNKRLNAKQAMKHDWCSAGKAKADDLGTDLIQKIQSVRQDDKISRVIGKVNKGTINIQDVEDEDKHLISMHVKNQQDVAKYLDMYNKSSVGASGSGFSNTLSTASAYNKPPQPVLYQPPPPQPYQAPNVHSNQYYNYGNSNQIYNPPPANGIMGNKLLFNQNAKQIFESIHMFKEQEQKMNNSSNNNNNNNSSSYSNVSNSNPLLGGIQSNGIIIDPSHNISGMNVIDDDKIDDDIYENQIKNTLNAMSQDLNDDEYDQALHDMLGDDYDDLKADIYKQKLIDDNSNKMNNISDNNNNNSQSNMNINRQVTHKNDGNPLNIQSEQDEEFEFDFSIVKQLEQLGMAGRNACIRAVLATDSKGINLAAEWLMEHLTDKNINDDIDVL